MPKVNKQGLSRPGAALGERGTTWAALLIVAVVFAGCTPSLHDVVAAGDLAKAKQLLATDPSLVKATNEQLKTPLHYAVANHRLEMLPILVDAGADVNARDITGMTPLHIAARFGLKDEAQWLLDHGAELEPKDKFGDTPVHTAAIFHGGLIGPLVKQGADPAAKNNAGLTPLEVARKYHNDKAAAYLEKLMKGRSG